MQEIDLSNFITWFFTQVINIITWSYNMLDHIKIVSGISLLDITITIFILTVMLPIIITIVKSRRIKGRGQN